MKTISKLKKNLVLVLVCVMLAAIAVSPASSKLTASGTTDAEDAVVAPSSASYDTSGLYYELHAETDFLQLWVDKTFGIFKVVNKANGYEWLSTRAGDEFVSDSEQIKSAKSLITVDYVNVDDEVSSGNFPTTLFSGAQHTNMSKTTFDFDSVENGFKINYVFDVDLSSKAGDDESSEEDIQDVEVIIKELVVPVIFSLKNDTLQASVDVKNIVCDEQLLLTKISLLPYFGAGTKNDEGYLFVPDGSGALINFKGHSTTNSSYNQRVYGDDLSLSTDFDNKKIETIRMPVFGLKNGNNAFCAIITSGAVSSSIEAAPANHMTMYSHANAYIETKLLSETMMAGKLGSNNSIFRFSEGHGNIDSFQIDYHFLVDEDADYVGMAKTYREHLQNKGDISKKASKPVLNVDTIGAIDVKANFLGFNYSACETLTSYKQTEKIVESLNKKGISQLGVRYIGWANNGVSNSSIVDDVDFISDLGGKSDFEGLSKYLKDKSIPFVTDVDLLTYSNGSERLASKSSFAETYYRYQYLRSVYSYDLNGTILMMLRPDYINEYAQDFLDVYAEDVSTKNLSLSTLTNTVYSSLKREETVHRIDTLGYYKEVFDSAKEKGINLYGERANEYSFKYISKVYKSPIYSSAFMLFDKEVPFYQIVLHGYISMTGDAMVQSTDKENVYLKCVESGSELLWNGIYEDSAQLADTNYDYYYGSTYTLWQDDAAEKYNAYYPLLNKIYDQEIVAHEEVANDVTMTEYENGIKVFVNFTNSDVTLKNGTKVPAKNFVYKEG